MNFFKIGIIIIGCINLVACSGGAVGFRGSPFWLATADKADLEEYFMGICLDKGYALDSREMKACIKSKPADPNLSESISTSTWDQNNRLKKLEKLERGRKWDCVRKGGVMSSTRCVNF